VSEDVGRVSAIWRFPVKSMLGESLTEAHMTDAGIVGDRAYALIDEETGKVVSAKSVKLFPDMLRCSATFVGTPAADSSSAPVAITLPEGTVVRSDDGDGDEALSRFFGRRVRLSSAAPEDFTIDQYHPDIQDADPHGYRDTVVEAKLGAAFFSDIDAPSPVPAGAFFDLFPVSVLTSSTLDKLSELSPGSRFDVRRFRMNVIVETEQPGFVENEWVGRSVLIEAGPRLGVAMPDPRCVMPTLAQGSELPRDADVLRTLVRNNRLDIEGARYPCAGVYAVVESPGMVKLGASVTLA
jgi:uncharacterized protein YcbX